MRSATCTTAIVAGFASAALMCCGSEPAAPSSTHALTIGAEIDLASTSVVPAPEVQNFGTLLTTPTGYIAVWSDAREQLGVWPIPPLRTYFARIALDGTVIDPAGIPLPATQPGFWTGVGVSGACEPGGTCMLIAHDGLSKTILGVRIAGDQVLDATPRVLFDAGNNIEAFSIAWEGSAYRVTWFALGFDIVWTASLAPDGTFGTPQAVATPANNPALACHPGGCLITYRSGNTIAAALRGRVVDAAGVLGPELVLYRPPGRTFGSAPYWDGQRYWVGLTNNQLTDQSQFGASVKVVRVASDGSVLDPDGITLAASDPLQEPFPPVVGHDGTTAEVVMGELSNNGVRSVTIARVADDGTVLDPGGVPFATSHPITVDISVGLLAAVRCHPGACLAAWTVDAYLDRRVHGTRFTGITELDPSGIAIATSPPGTIEAAITYAFGNYAAVWRDTRDSSRDPRSSPIRGAVFGPAMTPLSAIEVRPLSPPRDVICRDQDQPAIGASTTSYLVVWHEGCIYHNNLYGQVLDATAQAVAPAFVVDNTSGDETHPGVASDGSTFLAVWDNSAVPIEIQGRRFTAAGDPLGAAFRISASGDTPVVAFDGTNYLVVWRRETTGQPDLFAARVSPSGDVLGSEIVIKQTPAAEQGHSIACGGGVCLVAWLSANVSVKRMAPDGTDLDPAGIAVGTYTTPTRRTVVAWDGEAFVVTWNTGNQLRSQRIASTGALLPTTNPTISLPTVPDRPAIASNGAGHIVAFYDRFDPTSAFRVRRVRAMSIVDDDRPPSDAGVADAPADAPPDAPLDAEVEPGDAGMSPDDAAPPVDAGGAIDAGGTIGGRGGHGCNAASDPGPLGWIAGIFGLALRRRRRVVNARPRQ